MPKFGLNMEYRPYKCDNCGHIQQISTNHTSGCIDYCKECSWKPSFGDQKNAIPFNGRTYRPFTYHGGPLGETA